MSKKNILILCAFAVAVTIGILAISLYISRNRSTEQYLGKPRWVFNPKNSIFASAIDGKSDLVIQTLDSVYLLNPNTGETIWKRELKAGPTYGASLKISGNYLLVPGLNGAIFVLSAETGRLIWQDQPRKDPTWVEDIAIDSNTLYIARYSTYLTAYDISNGEVLWSMDAPQRTELYIFPYGENIYLGTDTSIYAYQTTTGKFLWKHSLPNLATYMTKKNNVLYLSNYQEKGYSLYAFNLDTNENIWSISQRKPADASLIRSIIVENNTLYGVGGRIVALSLPDGRVLWISNLSASYKRAVIVGNDLYALDRSYLYQIDKSTGVQINQIPLPGFPSLMFWNLGEYPNLFLVNDLLIFESNGQVYCYNFSATNLTRYGNKPPQ